MTNEKKPRQVKSNEVKQVRKFAQDTRVSSLDVHGVRKGMVRASNVAKVRKEIEQAKKVKK